MMDILVDDIDRYEQLSNREELLTLTSALAGNGAEQDSSAPRQFGTKTFRHPLKKTARHQDSSVPGQTISSQSTG
jgi:hypothetical protein